MTASPGHLEMIHPESLLCYLRTILFLVAVTVSMFQFNSILIALADIPTWIPLPFVFPLVSKSGGSLDINPSLWQHVNISTTVLLCFTGKC